MTSPEPKSEGGGVLPALLAGAGILLVGALFFFGGDDTDKEAERADTKTATNASAHTAKGRAGTAGKGVAGRESDAANTSQRPKPRLNPRIADSVVSGMGPRAPAPVEPTSFESREDEVVYWEGELTEANRMLDIRERAVERIPKIEERIRNGNDPVNGLADFEKRKEVVNKNLEKAEARIEDIQAKLDKLKAG